MSNRTDTYFYFKHMNDWINMFLSVFDVVPPHKNPTFRRLSTPKSVTSREIGFHLGGSLNVIHVSFSFVISQVSF